MHWTRVALYHIIITMAIVSIPSLSFAHGIAGKRFFPTTLSIDDPFVSDELSFLAGYIKEPAGEESSTKNTSLSLDFSKRLTQNLGISIGNEFSHLNPDEGKTHYGLGNLEVGIKYQFFKSDAHETILSLGVGSEIGGTGKKAIGAESFSVFSPTFFFGKGLGDLPEGAKYLRPLAITGVTGFNFPSRKRNVDTTVDPVTGKTQQDISHNPTTLTWGFAVQYNLQYLQSFVKDIGLPAPLNRMIFLVEFPFKTNLTHDGKGQTTGFVNPGITWFGKSMQLGIEARIPVKESTGAHTGVFGLVHFFIDDLFPKSLGRPIFDW